MTINTSGRLFHASHLNVLTVWSLLLSAESVWENIRLWSGHHKSLYSVVLPGPMSHQRINLGIFCLSDCLSRSQFLSLCRDLPSNVTFCVSFNFYMPHSTCTQMRTHARTYIHTHTLFLPWLQAGCGSSTSQEQPISYLHFKYFTTFYECMFICQIKQT